MKQSRILETNERAIFRHFYSIICLEYYNCQPRKKPEHKRIPAFFYIYIILDILQKTHPEMQYNHQHELRHVILP